MHLILESYGNFYSVGFNTSPLGATLFFVSTLVFESPARPQGVEVRP